jgi:hypothetical protein
MPRPVTDAAPEVREALEELAGSLRVGGAACGDRGGSGVVGHGVGEGERATPNEMSSSDTATPVVHLLP